MISGAIRRRRLVQKVEHATVQDSDSASQSQGTSSPCGVQVGYGWKAAVVVAAVLLFIVVILRREAPASSSWLVLRPPIVARSAAAVGLDVVTSSSPATDDDNRGRRSQDDDVTVFIGIKIGEGPRGLRFAQIRRAWLEDALDDKRVRIKFFTDPRVVARSDGVVPADEPAVLVVNNNGTREEGRGHRNGSSSKHVVSLRSILVQASLSGKCRTTKSPTRRLNCLTAAMFAHFLEHHANGATPSSSASYFCSFDDDQYVIVHNLLRVLGSYSHTLPWNGTNIYVGRNAATAEGFYVSDVKQYVHYLTGGAGYCLSRDLVERGAGNFSSLPRTADDVAVGAVVQTMGIQYIEDYRFHSHLENHLSEEFPGPNGTVSDQVSFGYQTKVIRSKPAEKSFPNVPLLFSPEEDPLRFRSLRCFIERETSGQSSKQCQTR